jgi:hypothetical protein
MAEYPTSENAGRKIFLSYRRADSANMTERIHDRLIERFGRENVFIDVDDMQSGMDFRTQLEEALSQCSALLVVIGDRWLSAQDEHGKRRLDDPHDFVRLEIETAFLRDITIIPLTLDDVSMPHAKDLPLAIQDLAYIQNLPIRHNPDFHADMDRLIARVAALTHTQPAKSPRGRSMLSVSLGKPQHNLHQSRNRRAMIEKVRAIWITDVLNGSFYQETRMTLGLAGRPDAVERPMDMLVQRPDKADQPLPPETRMVDVYDDLDRTLLILGAPGSGKTTLLLELARDLLDRAEQDELHPIPVVFPLSTWADHRRPLTHWLVDELSKRYDVPRKIGQAWVAEEQILPLLDGLDEMKAEYRAPCVEAINTFRRSHGLLPLVVCSRMADYEATGKLLRLQGAIVVQPLTHEQVDGYFRRGSAHLAAIHQALDDDPTLWELLDTPLMLHIVTVAYGGKPITDLQTHKTLNERRSHVFAQYVNQMFRRRSSITRYATKQTIDWLRCLARQMMQHSQTIFFIEQIQPSWLQTRTQRRLYSLLLSLIVSLFIGLVASIPAMQIPELLLGLIVGMSSDGSIDLQLFMSVLRMSEIPFGLITVLCFGFFGFIIGLIKCEKFATHEIKLIEYLQWAWNGVFSEMKRSFRRYRYEAKFPGLYSDFPFVQLRLAFRLANALAHGLIPVITEKEVKFKHAVLRSLKYSFIVGIIGVLYGIIYGMSIGMFNLIINILHPIYLASQLVNFPDISSMLYSTLVGSIGLGLILGLIFGLFGGFRIGGLAFIQYFILRFMLWINGYIPFDHRHFLDYATERIFLRKVGSGYMFIHRSLLEYFASLNADSKSEVDHKV